MCGAAPTTGFYRDGACSTGAGDYGVRVVCPEVTWEFRVFSGQQGHDLSTAVPESRFPGLKPGGRWHRAMSWEEAMDAGVAPPVILNATHISAPELVSPEELRAHALGG